MSLVRLSLALLLTGMGVSAALGQTPGPDRPEAVPDTVVYRVSSAFQSGNAQRLLSPAAARVEISLFGTRTFYSDAQAFYVLREFFDTHPPTHFALADTTGAGTSCFLRGRLEHARDERILQVYVRLVRQESDAWLLHEVRIGAGTE
jgi:hypothetical protein